jgi:hypothetical protein
MKFGLVRKRARTPFPSMWQGLLQKVRTIKKAENLYGLPNLFKMQEQFLFIEIPNKHHHSLGAQY